MSPTQTSNISAAVDRGALSFGSVGDGTLELRLSGRWCIGSELQSATTLNDRLGEAPGVKRITLTASELTAWDSVLLTFLLNVIGTGRALVRNLLGPGDMAEWALEVAGPYAMIDVYQPQLESFKLVRLPEAQEKSRAVRITVGTSRSYGFLSFPGL